MGIYAGPANAWSNFRDSNRIDASTKLAVQSGLVLNLDAGASTSYVGSGTTWTDLSDKISSATGALPIYNTSDTIGSVKGTGTRTDTNASSLVLAIPMDGANNGTTFTDESANIKGSGSAKAITRVGDTKTLTAVSKFYGSSGFFDGTGDYLSSASSADFAFGTGNFTIETWIYPTSVSSYRNFWEGGQNNSLRVQIAIGSIEVVVNGSQLILAGTITANTWTHVAVVRSGTTVSLYLNGISQASATSSANITSTALDIGKTWDNFYYLGYIQDHRTYKGVAKYTANFTPPGNPNNGTLTNGPTYSSANGGSIVFDGSNDYTQLTSSFNFGTSDFSISCWAKFSTVSGDTNYRTILSSYASGGTTDYIFGLFTTGVPKIQIYVAGVNVLGNTTLTTGIWYNLVATRVSGIVSLYVNGILDNTPTSASGTIAEASIPMIGRIPSASQTGYFNGNLSNLLVYKNRALSATEISQNYNALRARYGI